MDFSALLIKMFIFMVLLLTGYAMARKGILSPEFCKGASALLVNVFIVASIINSVLGNRPALSNAQLFSAFGILCLVILLIYPLPWLFSRFEKNEPGRSEMLTVMAVTNSLFVGMPILQAVSGPEAVFYVGLSCIPYNIILYSYGIMVLKKGSADGKVSLKDMLSVCLFAAVAAFLLFLIDPPIPRLVSELFGTVSAATMPVSMIIIGASLGRINPVTAFGDRKMWFICLERLILAPVIVLGIARLLTDDPALLMTCMVLGGVSVGTITTPLFIQYGHDAEYSSKAVMVTTVLCMVTLPLLLKIFFA